MPDVTHIYERYFKAPDLQAGPRVLTIKAGAIEKLKRQDGEENTKVVAYFLEDERGLVLNKTRFADLTALTGSTNTDKWVGTKVEVFFDPTVRNPNGPRGGLGVRAPK
jgi:hypothetical protein